MYMINYNIVLFTAENCNKETAPSLCESDSKMPYCTYPTFNIRTVCIILGAQHDRLIVLKGDG